MWNFLAQSPKQWVNEHCVSALWAFGNLAGLRAVSSKWKISITLSPAGVITVSERPTVKSVVSGEGLFGYQESISSNQ